MSGETEAGTIGGPATNRRSASHEGTPRGFEPEAGQQLYALVESCRKPEVLWDKLSTGNYDWLGMRRGGRFVIGRPRLSTVVAHDAAVGTAPAPHRVEISGPLDRTARHENHPGAGEARTAYERIIAGDPVTPLRNSGIWKVRLIVDGAPAEERLVVRTLPRVV